MPKIGNHETSNASNSLPRKILFGITLILLTVI